MKKIFTLLLFSCLLWQVDAQEEATISGYIKDASNGETLIGATIFCPSLASGTNTNAYGFYSLKVPKGAIDFEFSFTGYASVQEKILIQQDTIINIELKPGQSLETVIVSASSNKEQVNSTQMGFEKITMQEAKLLPALLGEVDIIKTLQLKPGVKTGGEGTSGIIVRGGSADQNLFLLDEATVYNPSHLFGFFSTFNSDAVKDVQLYKGGFPAQYGGRLSSVIDVKLNEGNKKKFSGTGGVGLVASRLTLEGPIQKDKSSFIVSGRRTYVDIITRQVNRLNEDDPEYDPIPDYYFY
ncbi:MAG: carboxypeptidase-like regulatory domain-containing protein, partial [Saprospiraceae bacterium]